MLYRIRQGLRALFAGSRSQDLSTAEGVLNKKLLALFRQMRPSEQEHSLRVLASVRSAGHSQHDLLVAALLHDVGKTHSPITLTGRTSAVLLRTFVPTLYHRWSSGEARGWRRPLVVAEQHPAWGAEMLAKAGASTLAVSLVRRHQDKLEGWSQTEEDQLLIILQAADALN